MGKKKAISKKIVNSVSKIADLIDLVMGQDGHEWEVDEIHFTSKETENATVIQSGKIVCRQVLKNGKYVTVCAFVE